MQPITRATIRALPRCALGFRLRACPSQALERTSFGCNYHHKASNLPLNTALAQCRRVNSSARCTSQDGAEVGSGGDGAQSPGGILLYELESKVLLQSVQYSSRSEYSNMLTLLCTIDVHELGSTMGHGVYHPLRRVYTLTVPQQSGHHEAESMS